MRWLVALVLVGCNAPSTAPGDMASGDLGFDAVRFASEVRAAVDAAGSRHCANALPNDPAADASAVRELVRSYVARAYGATAANTDVNQTMCGGVGFATCANIFNHHLYKSDGVTADALLASAQTVEREAASVEVYVFTPVIGGISQGPAVTIQGLRDGRILGIVFFNDLTTCP